MREFFILSIVGCVIPIDRPMFLFNDMEISMVAVCILEVLIISILELFPAFFHTYKHEKTPCISSWTLPCFRLNNCKCILIKEGIFSFFLKEFQ